MQYSNKGFENIEELILKNYQHMGIIFLEWFWLPEISDKVFLDYVRKDELSSDYRLLENESRAIILIGHHGNWEVLSGGGSLLLGKTIHFVTKIQKSKSSNFLVHKMRERYGNRMIPMEQSREILNQVLQKHKWAGLAGDQTASVSSYWDHFMGLPVPIFLGAAMFSLKNNTPIYMLFPMRQKNGKIKVYCEKVKSDDLDPLEKESAYILTTRHTRILEKYIDLYPDQYYWIHKRWKHTDKASQYYPKYHQSK